MEKPSYTRYLDSATNNYLSATRELMNARRRSQADDKFCARGNEIVYLFDTNICVSFLDTEDTLQTGSSGIKGLFSESIANSLDRALVRFLFEGSLPGQRQPNYMTPPHWAETISQMTRLSKKVAVRARQLDKSILDRLFALRYQPDNLQKFIERENLSVFLRDLTSAENYRKRIKSLVSVNENGEPRLSTIDRSNFWDLAGEQIRWEDYIFWQARLKALRGTSSNSKSKEGTQIKIDNDAMSLALIQSLYRETPGAIGENSHVKFVFVTADSTLFKVYNQHRDRFEAEGIPQFMRMPSDYTPIVNYAYMHERILASGIDDQRSSQLLKKIEEALRLSQPFGIDKKPPSYRQLRLNFKESRGQWNDIAETLILLGARYFVDDHTSMDVSKIADLFEEEDIVDAANRYLRDAVTAVRDDHTRQMSAAAIDRLLPAIRDKALADGGPSVRPRAPFRYLDIDIMEQLRRGKNPIVLKGQRLSNLISKIEKASPEEATKIATKVISSLKKSWGNPQYEPSSYLIAAGLYFSAGAWESARLCTDLCRTVLRKNKIISKDWRREARYAAALSLRMAMRSEQDFSKANNHLLENLRGATPSISTYRDTIERSALLMTACVLQMIENSTHYPIFGEVGVVEYMDEDDISERFDDAIQDAQTSSADLDGYLTSNNHFLISSLMGQAESNVLGAYIFSHMIPDLTSNRASKIMIMEQKIKVEQLLEEMNLRPRFTAQVYFKCAEVLEGEKEQDFREFLNLITTIRERRTDLSAADKVEQDFLCRWLSGLLNIPADDLAIRNHISFRSPDTRELHG